jgi:hypothetical protein
MVGDASTRSIPGSTPRLMRPFENRYSYRGFHKGVASPGPHVPVGLSSCTS